MSLPIVIEAPVRGEWLAPNTPGARVPSHGTDRFGARYAIDLIQVDWMRRGWPAYRRSLAHYLARGLTLQDYYCWGAPVVAPCDGLVVAAADGWPERVRTNLLADLRRAHDNARHFDPRQDDVRTIAGNHIIIQKEEGVYVALCHLQQGSVSVCCGQRVRTGQAIGSIGHSGNSMMPHLHMQLMDRCDIATAQGLPFAFARYEVFCDGRWKTVQNSVPDDRTRVRFVPAIIYSEK